MFRSARLLSLGLAVLLIFSIAQAAPRQDSYLIIYRSPHFGTQTWLRIWIDGNEAATISLGHDFRTPISAGRHVISAMRLPEDWPSRPSKRVLNLPPGKTCEFTAVWENDHVVLQDRLK